MEKVQVEDLDKAKSILADIVQDVKRNPAVKWADIRLEAGEGVGAYSEDGIPKASTLDWDLSIGVRVIAGEKTPAAGYAGSSLGVADFQQIAKTAKNLLQTAFSRAKASSLYKKQFITKNKIFGKTIKSTKLAYVKPVIDKTEAELKIDPRNVSGQTLTKLVCDAAKQAKNYHKNVKRVEISASTGISRQIFASSEGALIDQSTCSTGVTVFVLAHQTGSPPADLYHHIGNQLGLEAITEAKNTHQMDIFEFAEKIAEETVMLSKAKPAPEEDKPVTVVLDPDLVALFAHELIGHPAELDRALKMETGYAGRSWFFKNLEDNMVGKKIASPLLTAFSDPTLKGAYGFYMYDDEGTPAKRVYHIKNGIFQDFLNNKETAETIGATPNGHYKANDAAVVPLIRMSVTAIAKGKDDPEKIIKDVEDGYWAVGHRIPSISESRENFSIAPRLLYRIKNGQIKEVLRDGRIAANSHEFFLSIDAVGKDFKIFPIPNCGKGQPMQAKQVGNGGPTIRAKAKILRGDIL